MPRKHTSISSTPIDLSEIMKEVADDSAGGTVVFIGTIRNRNGSRRVKSLEYQVYKKMAERRMIEIEEEVRKRWRAKKVRMVHREGSLAVGEVSVVVAVSAEHRAEAFEACRYAIERIKEGLPLWKRETGTDGRKDWVEGSRISD